MSTFMQIIEFKTSRIDEFNSALDEWLDKTKGKRAATRFALTKERDANIYVEIVEFPSYDGAMSNSTLPETSDFAARLTKLCEEPPTFRNLDVIREEQI